MGAEHGVVKGSNVEGSAGDRRNNGYLPLSGSAMPAHAPNPMFMGGDKGMSMPAGPQGSPLQPPDHRFDVNQVHMPQPASAMQPGKGAIPVQPFKTSGAPAGLEAILRDSAKK